MYSFRPRKRAWPETWTLDGAVLSGPEGRIDLRYVQPPRFGILPAVGGRVRIELVLEEHDAGHVHLSCVDLPHTYNFLQFLILASEITHLLRRDRPALPFHASTRMVLFTWVATWLGTTALACGVAAANSLGLRNPWSSLGLLGALIGLLMVLAAAPWRTLPARDGAAVLTRLRGLARKL